MATALLKIPMHKLTVRTPGPTWILTLILLCLGIQAAPAVAQSSGSRSNASLLELHARVDELYERGEFERAFLIYRDELASIGDKYAQYMVGYMTLSGKGVRQDPIQASAWYRLAAERGTEEFEQVRDELLEDFDAAKLERSDAAYRDLRERYCDVAVLFGVIRDDLEELGKATGSRLSPGIAPMTIIDRRTGRQMSGAEYYGKIRQRLETRLNMIARLTGSEDFSTNPDEADIDELEAVVERHLRELP